MKRLRNCVLALLMGCCAPILIWVGVGVALYQRRKEAFTKLVCSIDADCPPGYVCVGGHCVRAR